jgi:hypothetical protein
MEEDEFVVVSKDVVLEEDDARSGMDVAEHPVSYLEMLKFLWCLSNDWYRAVNYSVDETQQELPYSVVDKFWHHYNILVIEEVNHPPYLIRKKPPH